MNSVFPHIIISALLLLNIAGTANARNSEYLTNENIGLLDTLDSMLAHADDYVQVKEDRISRLRDKFMHTADTEQKYWAAAGLYDEYAAFDSDSAMAYADRCHSLARELGREDLTVNAELNRIYVLTATGLLDKAEAALQKLDASRMNSGQLLTYCDRNINLASHRDQYVGYSMPDTAETRRINRIVDRAMTQIGTPQESYGWLAGWNGLSEAGDFRDKIRADLLSRLQGSKFETRDDALDAYVLSRIYDYSGDKPSKLKYLILSAIADIRGSVREIASLEEVAGILKDAGDFERANNYINYCIACADSYHSRVRMARLGQVKDQILSTLYHHSKEQGEANRRMVTILIAVVAALILMFLFIIRQMRQLSVSRKGLSDANANLHLNIEELHKTREELNEANARLSELYANARKNAEILSDTNEAKEKYIASIFSICSEYITKLDDFRKNIHRLIVAGKSDELLRMTKTPELPYGEMKELYRHFDRIFLQIYPDFVADFNTLLREEERIALRSPDFLTTELRIYALVRLGLNDSVKIAKFLHISVQTVYNTRQRTRNKAAIPKETFADAVMRLGKASI
ncbi:transcriptional regulator [Muribaculaceae bacterium Isolate-002 (NCI)]|nr:transcriptional regulator [Muribaculaceae bacterium Isolate-002 (NCI)]